MHVNADILDHQHYSKQLLIDACKSGKYPVIGGCDYGRQVIRIANDAVVKFGYGVTAAEAATQAFVYNRIDFSIFRVPKVHRFVEEQGDLGIIGYLLMEFVEGETLDNLNDSTKSRLSAKISDCLRHLWQIPIALNVQPGPISGGEPRGAIWSDDGARTVFTTLSDMQDWLNASLDIDEALTKKGCWDMLDVRMPLIPIHHRLNLAKSSLVICHGDFVGRNAILQPDGAICILDWGCAGCYPVYFDIYGIMCNESSDPALLTPLLQQLNSYKEEYASELELLRRVQRANTAYSRAPSTYEELCLLDILEPAPQPDWPERGNEF